MDIAPATSPATPATTTLPWLACEAATPSTRLEVDRIPSFAPSTAARNHPMRPVLLPEMHSSGHLIPPGSGCSLKGVSRERA